MLPYEILDLVDKEFATTRYTEACSPQFLKEVREFINDRIVQPAAQFRQCYDLYSALKPLGRNVNPFGKATGEFQYISSFSLTSSIV